MVIIRDGKEIELTAEELRMASKEYEKECGIFATQKWSKEDISGLFEEKGITILPHRIDTVIREVQGFLEDCCIGSEILSYNIDQIAEENDWILTEELEQ